MVGSGVLPVLNLKEMLCSTLFKVLLEKNINSEM